MNRKFSILNGIDLNKLDRQIYDYVKYKNDEPYIFMTEETINELLVIKDGCISRKLKSSEMVGCYTGCKLFVDSTLNFGEVELR